MAKSRLKHPNNKDTSTEAFLENQFITTGEASKRCDGLLSSKNFAQLAYHGKLPGSKKNDNIWLIPVKSVDTYVASIRSSTTIPKRIIQWWDKTSRISTIALLLIILALLVNSIDFFVNINSLFDIISPGTTLFIDKAQDDEILILVAEFSGQGGYDPTSRIYRSLDEAIKREGLDNSNSLKVEVRRVPNIPQIQDDAIKLGSRYQASIVIWGTYDQAAIEPNVEVLRSPIKPEDIPQPGMTVNQDQATFNLYLASGLPDDIEFLSFLVIAKSHMYLSEYEKAIGVLSSMLTYDLGERGTKLNLWYVYALRANSYQYLNDFVNAENDYLEAIHINPAQPGSYINLAAIKFQMRQYHDAIQICNDGLKIVDDHKWSLHFTKGGSYQQLEEHQAAIEEYSIALDLYDAKDVLRGTILMSRGTSYSDLQKWQEARNDFEASKKLLPDFDGLYHNWGIMELDSGNPQSAIEYFDIALEYGSKDPRTTQLRGVAYRELINYEKAREDFNYVISIAPDYGGGYYDRGVLERLEGNYEAALSDMNKTLEIWPDNMQAHAQLFVIYAHYKDWDKAIEMLTRLIKIESENINWVLLRAEMYLDLSDYANARIDYLTAKAVEPNNHRVMYGLGVVSLFHDLDTKQAIDLFDEAIKYNNQIQDVYLFRGVAYGLQGDYEAAKNDCFQFNNMRASNTGTRMGTFDECTIFIQDSVVFVGVQTDDGYTAYYGNPNVSP